MQGVTRASVMSAICAGLRGNFLISSALQVGSASQLKNGKFQFCKHQTTWKDEIKKAKEDVQKAKQKASEKQTFETGTTRNGETGIMQ